MPAARPQNGTNVITQVLAAVTADLVTLSGGGRVVTVFNWSTDSSARLYVQFDPPIVTGAIPGIADPGVRAIPPGCDRIFQRPGQNRPVVALVFGALNEYRIEAESVVPGPRRLQRDQGRAEGDAGVQIQQLRHPD